MPLTTRLFPVSVLLIILSVSPVLAGKEGALTINNAISHWTFLGGYGTSHPGFGETRTRVETADLILQHGYFLREVAGKSWYRSRHKLLVEIPVSVVFKPETAVMTGINFLAGWDFIASDKIIPYIFAGGGFVYTDLNIPGLGSDYNGNYQGGIGAHFVIRNGMIIDLNYRLHHISNLDTANPNVPLNSSKLLFGITFLR